MIELINFTKHYGDFTAVENLNLKIEAGELFGFIGPNGAGKSTSIRFLATLLKATSGEGIVNGCSVMKDPLGVRKSVGYMPDNFGVYDGMKVWEFLDFFAVAYQIPRASRKRVIGDVPDLMDLMHKRDAFVNSLSRGMKQRLCLAKTLVHDPPVLILDEPSSGLDPLARREILEQVISVIQEEGRTVFFSSHLLDEVERVSDRVGFMHRGRLVTVAPLEELHERWRRVQVVWPEAREEVALRGVRRAERRGREHVLITDSFDEAMLGEVRRLGAIEAEAVPMSLDDIFIETMRPACEDRPAAAPAA
jgi:ABC-2 type transport system ATP-binding protein